MNSNDLEARFDKIERLIKAEDAETRRHFGVVADGLHNQFKVLAEGLHGQIKLIAEGHGALRESISDLKEGLGRLEAGQSRLELRQLALESRQGQLEKTQNVTLSEVRLLASRVEPSSSPRTRPS